MSSKNPYVIYTRRSTDDTVNQKNSIDFQVSQCRRYAAEAGLAIAPLDVGGFCEQGVVREKHTAFKTADLEISSSGIVRYTIERPKFQRLVTMLAHDELAGVICLCWDRLSRNPHDDAIVKELRGRGVDIRFVQASYDQTSAGALHMDIDGMFAAHYSRVVSEKVSATNAKLRLEGKCTYRAPTGYLDGGVGQKTLDPERAPIVRDIFERYASGTWSFAELAKWALRQGLTVKPRRPSRTAEERLAGVEHNEQVAAPVSSKTIENILHNSFYAGRLRHDGLEMPGVHPPIVSTVLFERVQQMLTTRTTSTAYVDKAPYVYRGFFRCACGRGYYPYRKKGHAYYRSGCRPSCLNRAPNMPEHQLDSLVIGLLGEIDFTPSEVDQLVDLAPKVRGDAVRDQETAAQTALRERAKLTRDLAYLEDNKITLLREGVYDAKSYSDDKARISSRLSLLDNPPEIVASDELLKTARGVLELVRLAKACYKRALDHEKQQMLAAAFLELIVTDGEVKEIRGRDHVDVLVRSMVVPSGRPKFVLLEMLRMAEAGRLT